MTDQQVDAARRMLATPERAPVKGKRLDPQPGEGLLWTEISDDGGERARRGPVWCSAAPIKGRRSWFVHDLADERVVRVSLASRRHQVGRRVSGRWRAAGGRFVDVGTVYTETAPESATAPLRAPLRARPEPPIRRRTRPLPENLMRVLSGEASELTTP